MLSLARGGYTEQEIIDVLHAKRGNRNIRFRYKLLDKNNLDKGYLDNVIEGGVKYASFNDIKRTATFKVVDDGTINFLSDRIQPIFEIKIKNDWIQFPMGVFLLASPKRSDNNNNIERTIEAYDGLLILVDDKTDDIWTVSAGTNYKTAIINLLESAGITQYIIEDTNKVLSTTQVFEIGSSKLSIINELISQINFTPIRVDVYGNFVSNGYVAPSSRGIEYTYKDDSLSVTYKGMTENFDLFNVANKWVVVVTNAETTPLKSVYINENVSSLTSTVNRGRVITDYREIDNMADQQSLNDYVLRIANESSQIFGEVEFETAIMPHHDYMDLLKIEYSSLGINDKYVETAWEFNFNTGAKMKHFCRRVVTI